MKTVEYLCSQESLSKWKWLLCCWSKAFIHELNLRLYGRPANDTLYRLLLLKSMGVCEKDCSSKAFLCLNFSFLFSNLFFLKPNYILHEKSHIRIFLNWRNELNKETRNHSLIKEFERNQLGFLWTTTLGIRDSHAVKLMANLTERNGLVLSCEPSLCIHFHWSLFFSSVYVFVLFCSVFSFS